MKIRLQDAIKTCANTSCKMCKYNKNGECIAKINGYIPQEFLGYYCLCKTVPELAKALCTNEEIELYENDSEKTD